MQATRIRDREAGRPEDTVVEFPEAVLVEQYRSGWQSTCAGSGSFTVNENLHNGPGWQLLALNVAVHGGTPDGDEGLLHGAYLARDLLAAVVAERMRQGWEPVGLSTLSAHLRRPMAGAPAPRLALGTGLAWALGVGPGAGFPPAAPASPLRARADRGLLKAQRGLRDEFGPALQCQYPEHEAEGLLLEAARELRACVLLEAAELCCDYVEGRDPVNPSEPVGEVTREAAARILGALRALAETSPSPGS